MDGIISGATVTVLGRFCSDVGVRGVCFRTEGHVLVVTVLAVITAQQFKKALVPQQIDALAQETRHHWPFSNLINKYLNATFFKVKNRHSVILCF